MNWFTCKKCPPHGMADHSIYGQKDCLATDCPCKGYVPDETKPETRKQGKTFIGGPFSPKS